MPDLTQFQTHNLFLLIGTNPLPNYVAARLVAKPKSTLYLVHSGETYPVAQRLAICLEHSNVECIPVDDSDPSDIVDKVQAYAQDKRDVGLNYTGGTKVMAVHAYRVIQETNSEPVFSYLDARTLKMRVSRGAKFGDFSLLQEAQYRDRVAISLETLLRLHGVESDSKKWKISPIQIDLCSALANLHTTKSGTETWRNWHRKSHRWSLLPDKEQGLEDVENALEAMCGGNPTPESVAAALGYESLPSCAKWFMGEWLENHTLYSLQQAVKDRDDFQNPVMDLYCTGRELSGASFSFQFDIAVMRGYQLFAISCIVSDDKSKCKEHLFEAYIRARQMGGDEARVALVCAYRQPEDLLAEIERPWDAAGKIRVFGAKHLPNLSDWLNDWFNSQP